MRGNRSTPYLTLDTIFREYGGLRVRCPYIRSYPFAMLPSMTAAKTDWNELSHDEKLDILQRYSRDALANEYCIPGLSADDFVAFINAEYELWNPNNLGPRQSAGKTPLKDIVIGSWRDLNRSEALLELIDNSIDAWRRRRTQYPATTAKKLRILIDVDPLDDRLTYEDNAGGVSPSRIENLVIPGHSDTTDFEATIGSYRTGGKKAVFKLAREVNIRTSYLDPSGSTSDPLQIHLDQKWLEDQTDYDFPFYVMNTPDIDPGHTRYTFRLRDRWDTATFDEVTTEIRRTYTLLMLRFPIQIFFNDRLRPLEPLQNLYTFSGKCDDQTDLRPQRINFLTSLPWADRRHRIRIEIIMGCRTTTAGSRGEDGPGIDLYGNDRLFILRDQEQVRVWYPSIPKGAARLLIRGQINIHAPNIFIPWDVHKRHLNADRELVTLLRTSRLMILFINGWTAAYQMISRGHVKDLIKEPFLPWQVQRDINVCYDNTIEDLVERKRGVPWPSDIHMPTVASPRKDAEKNRIIKFPVNRSEFRELCSKYDVPATWGDSAGLKDLSLAVKDDVLTP